MHASMHLCMQAFKYACMHQCLSVVPVSIIICYPFGWWRIALPPSSTRKLQLPTSFWQAPKWQYVDWAPRQRSRPRSQHRKWPSSSPTPHQWYPPRRMFFFFFSAGMLFFFFSGETRGGRISPGVFPKRNPVREITESWFCWFGLKSAFENVQWLRKVWASNMRKTKNNKNR